VAEYLQKLDELESRMVEAVQATFAGQNEKMDRELQRLRSEIEKLKSTLRGFPRKAWFKTLILRLVDPHGLTPVGIHLPENLTLPHTE